MKLSAFSHKGGAPEFVSLYKKSIFNNIKVVHDTLKTIILCPHGHKAINVSEIKLKYIKSSN